MKVQTIAGKKIKIDDKGPFDVHVMKADGGAVQGYYLNASFPANSSGHTTDTLASGTYRVVVIRPRHVSEVSVTIP